MALTPHPQRHCGDCALCCHLGEITDFKPFNQWCTHCSTRAGCDIYEARPQLCRDFHCHYLQSDLSDDWFPKHCGFIVATYMNPPRVLVSVDPASAGLWWQSLYLEQLQHWALSGAVQVQVGARTYAVDEAGIRDLGEDAPDSMLVILEQQTPQAMRYRLVRQPR